MNNSISKNILSKYGYKIFLRSWSTEKTPSHNILIIHGLGEHSGRYDEFANYFLKKNIGVFAFDLVGHGKSEGTKGHVSKIQNFIDDIEEVLIIVRKKYIDIPIILFGHSLGGCLVLNYLIERKSKEINSAIVSSSWIITKVKLPKYLLKFQHLISVIFPRVRLSNRLNPNDLSKDREVVKNYINDPYVHDRISLNLFKEVNKGIKKIKKESHKLNLPILIIHGKKDKIISYKGSKLLNKKIIHSKLRLFENIFHEPHNDLEKEEVLNLYFDFINSVKGNNF